jgi:hypothetical protein
LFKLVETVRVAAMVADIPTKMNDFTLEDGMAPKNKPQSKASKPTSQAKKPRRTASSRAPHNDAETLDALSERLDMMLPEVMARIAAVEHVLIKKKVCVHADLLAARQFIDEQERF